jgi:hypothetical protein
MRVFEQLAQVQAAQRRTAQAREALRTPVSALLERGHAYPLTTMGAAAGAGFVLGSLDVHPLRVPGVGPLLSGGLADALAFGTRMIAELGLAGAVADRNAGTDENGGEPA